MPNRNEVRRRRRARGLPLILAVFASAGTMRADDAPDTEAHVAIHGYLTQAYATARHHQYLGIPQSGTADYRTAALQVRFGMTSKDSLVVQLSHERNGSSPVQTQKDIDLDWGFYERRFSPSFSFKVGKVPIPFGIFNEVRDVGTVLPFYRPASEFYGETSYGNETVAGVLVSARTGRPGSLGVDADAYFGEWDFLQRDRTTRARVGRGLGVEVWLRTPLDGLRVGVGGWRGTVTGLLSQPAPQSQLRWHVSADGDFKRLRLTGEYAKIGFQGGAHSALTGQLEVRVTEKLRLNAASSRADLEAMIRGLPSHLDISRDNAVGVNYAFRPDLVGKLEHHWNKGYGAEDGAPLTAPVRTKYLILSLSASF